MPTVVRTGTNAARRQVTISLPRWKPTSVTSASATRSVVKTFLITTVSAVRVSDWASTRRARKPQAASPTASAIQRASGTWLVHSVKARIPVGRARMMPVPTTRAMRTSRGGRHVRAGAPPGASVISTRGIVWVYVRCWLASEGGEDGGQAVVERAV